MLGRYSFQLPEPPRGPAAQGAFVAGTRRPVFVTHRRPGPGKVLPARDVCPSSAVGKPLDAANVRRAFRQA